MADEDRFYVEDEFVMDRQTGDVKYDDMRGRVGQIVAELLNYVEALEQSQSTVASSARAGALEEAEREDIDGVVLSAYIHMLKRFWEGGEPNLMDVMAASRGWLPLTEGGEMSVTINGKKYRVKRETGAFR